MAVLKGIEFMFISRFLYQYADREQDEDFNSTYPLGKEPEALEFAENVAKYHWDKYEITVEINKIGEYYCVPKWAAIEYLAYKMKRILE